MHVLHTLFLLYVSLHNTSLTIVLFNSKSKELKIMSMEI